MTRLAARLLDHAAHIMPPSRRDWVRGMRAELSHIPSPLAAAAFALGCVQASYMQRLQDMMTLVRLSRWAFAAYALVGAGSYLLVTALFGAIKAEPNLTPADLGRGPGTAENLQFAQGYPVWQLAGFLLIAGLLTTGAILLVRRRSAALPLLSAGVAAATLIAVLDRGRLGASDWPLAWSVAWLIPLACLAPVWWLSRRAPDLATA